MLQAILQVPLLQYAQCNVNKHPNRSRLGYAHRICMNGSVLLNTFIVTGFFAVAEFNVGNDRQGPGVYSDIGFISVRIIDQV